MTEDKPISFEILHAIRRIVRRLSEHSRQISRDSGLTIPQLLTLKALAELREEAATDEVTLGKLSNAVQLSAATMSGIVDRLVRARLISRERGTVDRRRVCLSLTPEGEEKLVELPTPLQDRFIERLAALDDPERQHLLAALHRIIELMEAEEVDAAPAQPDGDG